MKNLLNTGQVLGRSEMKKIMAGSGNYSCQTYCNGSWSGYSWNVADAQSWYNNHPDCTGYCCASCGNSQFPGAT